MKTILPCWAEALAILAKITLGRRGAEAVIYTYGSIEFPDGTRVPVSAVYPRGHRARP